MHDLDIVISQAWSRIAPTLLASPAELARRLARRSGKCFTRPLRDHCVSIRASDLRIDDWSAIIHPRHAIHLDASAHPGRYAEHRVQLTKDLLHRLCEPVEIGCPGEPADEVAKRLGCTPDDLMPLRKNGFLRTTPKPGLRGRHGRPVPLIYTPEPLNPQSRGRVIADDIFAGAWRNNVSLMPDGFRQWLTRIPRYTRIAGRDKFQGWLWLCPRCRKPARILYCPAHHMDYPTWIGFTPAHAPPAPRPAPIFACHACHGVVHFCRVNVRHHWNQLILHLSGGLLYGHEVDLPDWLTEHSKRTARRPNRNPRPAPRMKQIEGLLIDTGLTQRQIAAQLNICPGNVALKSHLILKRHNVSNRAELKALLRPQAPKLSAAG